MLIETETPKRHEITPFDPERIRCKTQTCKRPLTRLGEPWNCWICLHCNTHPAEVNKAMAARAPDQHPHGYIKDSMTPAEVKELVDRSVAAALAKQNQPAQPKYNDDDDDGPEILGKQFDEFPDVTVESESAK